MNLDQSVTTLEQEAAEIGQDRGWKHAAYADAYEGGFSMEGMEETDIEVPERYESVCTYYTGAFLSGCAEYVNSQYTES
jgi:hypothetical protein